MDFDYSDQHEQFGEHSGPDQQAPVPVPIPITGNGSLDPQAQPEPAPESHTAPDEPAEQSEPEGERPRQTQRKRSRSGGEPVTAATVARVLARAAEVDEMGAEQRELSAAVLGVPATVEALVAASLSGSKATGQHAADLLAVMDADPDEAGVVCMQAGRTRMRAMWKLAHQLGLIGQDMPASDAKAAIALARAARDDAGRERLARAVSTLGWGS